MEGMNRLLFDDEGRFIGVSTDNEREKKFTFKKDKLLTSQELTFLNKEGADNELDSEYWSLYSADKRLEPLVYSNGKTQEDVVREAVELARRGKKIILIHGVCGTGKSAIALNIARILGKTAIIVPVKNLQKQYEEDYTKKKYLLKHNGEKMRIAVITGRDNHDSVILPGISCADPFLPDTILITEKNRGKILEYYSENPFIEHKSITSIRRLKRISIAPSNPYWSPIRPAEFELTQLADAKRKHYKGVLGRDWIFYHRKEGCSYYDQFQAYVDADVLIFNSAKYEIEMAIGRKPETEVDIIDEADAFLDNFSKEDSINLNYLSSSLQNLFPEYPEAEDSLEKIKELVNLEIKNKGALGADKSRIFPAKETFIGRALKILLKSDALQAEISMDEMHYANKALETAIMFDELFEDTYVNYRIKEGDLHASLISTNVAKRFEEMSDKTKTLILMSGTLHSEDVLKNVFGIEDYAIIDAETMMPGKITISETGLELNCDYKNLNSGENKRKEYLHALSKSLQKADRPSLVHVNAYEDLPDEDEREEYSLTNVISKEKLREEQMRDKTGERILKFKAGATNVLFSTKCSRGVDFPGEMCNSIIFTKYPNPSIKDIFWEVLKKTHPNYFWSIYTDKARREFLQRIYRALRSQDDKVTLLSPDLRVLDAAKKIIAGKM